MNYHKLKVKSRANKQTFDGVCDWLINIGLTPVSHESSNTKKIFNGNGFHVSVTKE